MTLLTIDVIRLFFAFTVVVCIVTIAAVIIANTADVDSMADPAPRPGEDDNPQTGDGAGAPGGTFRAAAATASPASEAIATPAPSSSTKAALHRAQTAWFPDRSEWDQQ